MSRFHVGGTALVLVALGLGGCLAGLGPKGGVGEEAAAGNEARQLTRGLDDELSPAIDPVHRRLYFVSNQGQDREIWYRPLAGGPPRRITNDPADDFDPAVSFDGGTLAFVSQRQDAKGDIFLLRLSDGRPERLTDRSTAERQPAFMPDGRLVFTRSLDGGGEAVFLMDVGTRAVIRLTQRDGFDPAPSPDGRYLAFTSPSEKGFPCVWLHDMADGRERPLAACDRPEAFPAFAEGASPWQVVFSRFQDDTNGDGRIDMEDRPSLWRVAIDGGGRSEAPFPLTAGQTSDIQPRVFGGQVYYASRIDGGLDVWRVPLSGLGRPMSDRRDALARVNGASDVQQALYWLRRAERELGNLGDVELMRVLQGERLLEAQRPNSAAEVFSELATQARMASVRNRARWGLLAAQVERELPRGLTPAQREQRRERSEALLRELEALPVSASRRSLLRAQILDRMGRWDEALAELEIPAAAMQGRSRLAVKAWLHRADLRNRAGDPAGAEADARRILGAARATPADRRRAAQFLVEQALSLPAAADERPVLERMQALARGSAATPELAGRVGLALGDLLRSQGQTERAREAWLAVFEREDVPPDLAGRALQSLSRLDRESGNTGPALDRAVELLKRHPDDPAAAVPARRELEELGRRTLDDLAARSEVAAALRVAQRMLEADDEDPTTWRRWIELMARSGKAGEAVRRCRERLARKPTELSHYLVGLSLTYLEPPRHFSQAQRHLERALAMDERMAFAHQTLGWIEEQRGRAEGDPEALGRAAAAYQAALQSLDARTQPEAEADLLQNLGNVHFALGNYRQAYQYLRRRESSGFPFRHPVTRRIFSEQLGRASFLAGEAEDARRSFQAAILGLEREGDSKERGRRRGWLWSALAASHQMAGDHAAAVEAFAQACRIFAQEKQTARQEICQRNMANSLAQAGRLAEAAAAFAEAQRLLDRLGPEDESGAGLSVAIRGRGSRAAFGFRREQERHLLSMLQSRVLWQMGEPWPALEAGARALEWMEREMAADGEEAWAADVARAASQQAGRLAWVGEPAQSAQAVRRSLSLAEQAKDRQGMAVAGINMARLAATPGSGVSWPEAAARLDAVQSRFGRADESEDPSLARRFFNAWGVAQWQASLANRSTVRGRDDDDALRSVLSELDRALDGWQRAEAALARACAAEEQPQSRAELSALALACDNLAEARARLGLRDEADRLRKDNRARVEQHRLLDIGWRLGGRPDEERAREMLALPPEWAGTRSDASARRSRDDLLLRLGEAALSREDLDSAFEWLDNARLRDRQDRLLAEDVEAFAPGLTEIAQRYRQLISRGQQAMTRLEPGIRPEERASAQKELDEAQKEFEQALLQADRAGGLWLLAGRAFAAVQVRAALLPEEGLLLGAALPQRWVGLWLTRDGVREVSLPVAADDFRRELAAALDADPERSAPALRKLEQWVLDPLRPELEKRGTLILSGDAARLPIENFARSGSAPGPRWVISRIGVASDLVWLRRGHRFNFRIGGWRGGPQPEALVRRLSPGLGGFRPAGSGPAAGDDGAGVIVFGQGLRGNPVRLMRTFSGADEKGAALDAETARASLWIVPARFSDAAANEALAAALIATGVSSALVVDGSLLDEARLTLLAGVVSRLPRVGVARALQESLASGRPGAGRGPVGFVLGDPGFDSAQRRARAEAGLPGSIQTAMAAYTAKRWREAAEAFSLSRFFARFLGRDELLPRLEQGLVQCHFQMEDYATARFHQQQIVDMARRSGDEAAVARAQVLLGVLEARLKNHATAEDRLRRAAEELERLGARAEAAGAWTNLALALDGAARYPEALEALRRASVLHQAAGERASVLKLSRNAGAIHLRRLNDHAAARQRFREAMGIARELSDRAQEAALLLDLARCDLAAGEYSGARQNAERARELYGELGDPAGQAAAFIERAHADWYRGDYPEAWVAQGRALELAERSADRRLAVMARSLGGLIALNLGDLAEAEQRLSQALAEARRARLADEEATQLNNLGAVAREAGATETARQRFEEALRLDEERKNELGRAYDMRNLGQLELSVGRFDAALGFLAEAERLSRAVGDRFNLAKALLGLADAEQGAGRDSAAKAHAEEAERLSAELGLREIAWRAQRVLGDLRARAGELEPALAHYQAALQRMESLRTVAGGDLQALSSADKYELYDAAVQTLLRLGREDSALEMAERARSRRLLDLLSGRAIRAGGRAAELLAVIAEADRVASGLAECRDGNPEDCPAAMHRRRGAALEELRRLQPELAERIEALPLSVEELSRRLPDDTGLLYLHQGRERLWVWLLKKDRRALRAVELSRAELARRISGLRDGIERFENVDAELEWLHRALIAPVFSEMEGVRRLGIVPHGMWARVPFAALRAPDGSYLGERFDLIWLHSAGIAEQLLRRFADRMGPAGSPVVVGNPEVPGLPPLPLADLEAREVAHELAGAEVLLGPDATRARVMERLAGADVVHLACHGVHESRQPLRSRLQLSSSRAEEGTLEAQEVFDLSLSARLVTLSACETALSGGVAGDEVAGFPRAFLAAGAENVIASLWRVADPATAMLMKRLYRELALHPPARALRLAQEVVRRYFPHPAYWAGFVLFGLGR